MTFVYCSLKNCCGVLGLIGMVNGLSVAPATGVHGPARFVADNRVLLLPLVQTLLLVQTSVRFVPVSIGGPNCGGGTTVTVATKLVAVLAAPLITDRKSTRLNSSHLV